MNSSAQQQDDVRKRARGKRAAFAFLLVFAVFQLQNSLPTSLLLTFLANDAVDNYDARQQQLQQHQKQQQPLIRLMPKHNSHNIHQHHQQREEDDDETANNKKLIETRRQNIENICNIGIISPYQNSTLDPESLRNELKVQLSAIFTPPLPLPPPPQLPPTNVTEFMANTKYDPVKPCMYTFIDLGANIGDSLGKFIQAAFPENCLGLNVMPYYNLDSGNMTLASTVHNDLVKTAKKYFQELSHRPEDYCYVGVEGNPMFTSRMERLETMVMGTVPRPIRAAHFYTETVVTKEDGPTFLYLDTVNDRLNYWGSSLLEAHPDVRRSRRSKKGVKAPVMGLTLSTLLQRSVQRIPGAHVWIKMDIEGAEYSVINEAIDTLCSYKRAGVRVDLIMETHPWWWGVAEEDYTVYHNVTKRKLVDECNITRDALSADSGQ